MRRESQILGRMWVGKDLELVAGSAWSSSPASIHLVSGVYSDHHLDVARLVGQS